MQIGIIGGGPSGLFLYKHLVQTIRSTFSITIFEESEELGSGMPYSGEGANREHVTNVSGNEIPPLPTPLTEWLKKQDPATLNNFDLDPDTITKFKVVPRLLFGQYLRQQFELLQEQSGKKGIHTQVHTRTRIVDIVDVPEQEKVTVTSAKGEQYAFDKVIICTGHQWPTTHEGKVPGYFDSPYPPAKIEGAFDHPVALKGSSLTAIDAIRTLARHNGTFIEQQPHRLIYQPDKNRSGFRIVMHSLHGLLPAIRFHLDDPRISTDSLISAEEITAHREKNDGFLSLDFLFERNFKNSFRKDDPLFYSFVKNMTLEEFVDKMMGMREDMDPFELFKLEYAEAAASIRKKESIYWKEKLASLSFALNYPAKYLSAEDMLRLQQTLMPLISLIIAFVPQSSCEEMLALYEAGVLSLVAVEKDSRVEPHPDEGIIYFYKDDQGRQQEKYFQTYIDCIGQPHFDYEQFPFKTLRDQGAVTAARLRFQDIGCAKVELERDNKKIKGDDDGEYYLTVPGVAISDNFNVVDEQGRAHPRIYLMAVPHMGGYNPDYSGLDFCEQAGKLVAEDVGCEA